MMGDWITPQEGLDALQSGTGEGVRIAVLDSGVEIGHPEFAGRALVDDFAVDLEQSEPLVPGLGRDGYGHGTAVAGAIWRVAPMAKIGSFRVLGPDLSARSAQIAVAAQAAIERGYQILNCSFACGIPGHLRIYHQWVLAALANGAHVVASADDGHRDEWPGSLPCVLAARHGNPNGPLGLSVSRQSPSKQPAFAVAQAHRDLPWCNGSTRLVTGSSFASATLSGFAARVLGRHPIRDPHLLKALLTAMARES